MLQSVNNQETAPWRLKVSSGNNVTASQRTLTGSEKTIFCKDADVWNPAHQRYTGRSRYFSSSELTTLSDILSWLDTCVSAFLTTDMDFSNSWNLNWVLKSSSSIWKETLPFGHLPFYTLFSYPVEFLLLKILFPGNVKLKSAIKRLIITCN